MTLPRLIKIPIPKFTALCILSFLISLSIYLPNYKVRAASLYLNPATGTIEDKDFSLQLTLDTQESSNVSRIIAYISYDPISVNVSRILDGDIPNYNIKEIDPGLGLITIEGEIINYPLSNQILDVATIEVSALENSTNTSFELLTTSPYKSDVIDSSGQSVLTNSIDANITLDYNNNTNTSNPSTNYSSNTNVPKTGSFSFISFILISTVFLVLSYTIRKNAVSKL